MMAIVFVIVFAVDSDIDSVLESDSSTDIPDVVFPKSFIVYNGTLIIFPISNTNKYWLFSSSSIIIGPFSL